MKITSSLSKEELISSWDEYTSPSRFAGSDGMFDDVFISKRKDDKVTLTRKPRESFDMFTTVFRGRINKEAGGSSVKGVFTVGVIDYIVSVVFAFVYGYIVYTVYERSGSSLDGKIMLLVVLGLVFLFLALRPRTSAKKKYMALFDKITEKR